MGVTVHQNSFDPKIKQEVRATGNVESRLRLDIFLCQEKEIISSVYREDKLFPYQCTFNKITLNGYRLIGSTWYNFFQMMYNKYAR